RLGRHVRGYGPGSWPIRSVSRLARPVFWGSALTRLAYPAGHQTQAATCRLRRGAGARTAAFEPAAPRVPRRWHAAISLGYSKAIGEIGARNEGPPGARLDRSNGAEARR